MSSENLIKKFSKFEENGRTALGPALLASLALVSDLAPGSIVVICTDGLANMGLGSLETE